MASVAKKTNNVGLLSCAAIVLLALAVGALVSAIWQLRNDERNDAFEETGNLATVFAGQLARFLETIDIVLAETQVNLNAIDSDVPNVWRRALVSKPTHDKLKEKLARLPQAFNIAVADANGQILASTANWPAPAINIADRDYFQNARDQSHDGLTISTPIRNRINGQNSVVFARSMKGSAGEFIGIVYLSVNTEYFGIVYDLVKSVRDLTFTLASTNGTILVRYPNPTDRAGENVPKTSPWYEVVASGGGSFRSIGNFDGRFRLVSVRHLQSFPLVVSVSTLEDTALSRWRIRAIVLGLGGLAFVASSLYLLVMVVRKMRSLSASQAALREKSSSLERSNMRFDAALNNMSQGLCMFDGDQRIVVANARYREMYGLSPDQVKPGTTQKELSEFSFRSGSHAGRQSEELFKDHSAQSSELKTLPDGRVISVSREPMRDGGWVTTHEDITERHRDEARITFMARHDMLTGLENRAAFVDKLDSAAARLRRRGEAFAVLMLDLDRFKEVNDTLGHAAGDALLRQVAQRLKGALRETDVLARLGGDEFAVLQSVSADQRGGADDLASRIVETIIAPYEVNGSTVTIGTSIGIALAPEDGSEPSELLKLADLALYRSKSEGRNGFRFFHSEMLSELQARHQLERQLRDAISRNEFEVHYQPVIDVRTCKPCGAEALVRWRHPERGLLDPDQFIPLAEETGLIVSIGEWILQKACADAAQWPAHTKVAVNLSAMQFMKSNLIDVILCALVESGLSSDRLEVEITETALLRGDADYLALMRQLKNLGVMVAVDDFGTGYSSLSYLTMFPFDKIKIDRSFTRNLTRRSDCAAIVSAVIALGSGLDIKTVAEGVETEQQFQLLRAAGVDFVQGYLFAQPSPASELDFERIYTDRCVENAA